MEKQNKVNIDKWNQIHRIKSWQAMYPSENAQAFARYHVKGGERSKILDLGCGTGRNSLFFHDVGLDVYACDASDEALISLRNNNSSNNLNILKADFTDLPYDNNYFDYIFSEAVLYYGTEAGFISGVNEIHRCLKQNGVARIFTKTDQDYWTKYGKSMSNDTFIAQNHEWEDNLEIYCAPYSKIVEFMGKFVHVSIGIEEFNYVSLDSRKSFWVITATK